MDRLPTDDPCQLLYLDVIDRIEALVDRGGVLGVTVRACPGWSGRDLLGHLVGIAQDWVAGRLDGYASTRWTTAQVHRNAELSEAALMVAWREVVAELVTSAPHLQLGRPWRWLFGDALIHDADLREAVTTEDGPPASAVEVALGQIVARWRREIADAAGSAGSLDWPGLRLVDPTGRSWTIDASTVATGAVAPVTDPITVEAPMYELWRVLTGRRSSEEIAALRWSRDPAPVFDRGLPYPFQLADGGRS